MHWTLWDWSRSGREEEAIIVQQEIIRSRKDAFDQGLSIQNEKYLSEIRKFEEAAQRDREIVTLREKIRLAAASQYENGVITASDYIRELNAETEARIILELHMIQLIQTKISYLTTQGII